MVTERLQHGFETLLDAINSLEEDGFSTEFVCDENGFLDPDTRKTYSPASVYNMEFIRIYSPLSEPDEESIVYILEMTDGKKGWISDSYGYNSNVRLTEHINQIKENHSYTK